ncbi:MAG: hypothetical protein HY900_23820 [Deltaproteobacteria bacterium]|nr:hypothetical protein [Deltaproteobacteria bacterium]
MAQTPTRLRPTCGNRIGTTAFFRNRPLLDALWAELSTLSANPIRVLFHACSIGSEAYSLAIYACLAARSSRSKNLQICATDIERSFLAFGRNGVFPEASIAHLSAEERSFFEPVEGDTNRVRVNKRLRDCVSFLEPSSFSGFSSKTTFAVVFMMNALIYADREIQAQTIDRITAYNTGYLIVTGFHMDTIKEDLRRNSYRAVLRDIEPIHEAWSDRRVVTGGNELVPGVIFHRWSLDPFKEIEDFEYKYCSIFKKE